MTGFVLASSSLLIAALLLLLRPWQRSMAPPTAGDAAQTLNAAIHRDRLAELDRDRANGMLSAADHAQAVDELKRQLLADTEAAPPDAAAAARPANGQVTAIALVLTLPLLSFALYLMLGQPGAMLPEPEQNQRANANLEKMAADLAQTLAKDPANPAAWAVLARSYKAMGRWAEAAAAFDRIGPALQKDAGLLADLAETLAQQEQSFTGRPQQLLQQALQLEPGHANALLLGGTAAFEAERYDEAIKLWQRLLQQLEPGSEDAQMIQTGIAKALAASNGKDVPAPRPTQ